MSVYGLVGRVGRRRRPEPVVVTVVVAGETVVLPPESALVRAIGEVAAVLAHW